jgi:hypothetical protein
MTSPDGNEEVARRVRRVVGFKVMRDLHKVAEGMRRDDQQRPRLLLQLLVLTAVLAILVAVLVRF